jgi:iron complex transport system substrate-binding protein
MKKKLCSILVAGLLTLSLFTGCGKTEETETTTATTTEATTEATEEATKSDASGVAAQDRAGNDIYLPEKVERIISMAPSTTRFLIDIGLADKIVAIDTNSYAYADQLSADVQQFDMMAPDNEALIALEPDIIFTSGMSNLGGDDVYQSARDAGICVFDIPSSNSMDDIALDMVAIGNAVGEEEETNKIVYDFNDKIEEIQKIGEEITDKKTVLFELSLPTSDYPSIYTFGSGTYLDEMITNVGAVNVTGDQESWISISEEEAIAMNPDVIITNVNYVDDATGVIMSSEGWEEVTAIKNQAVYYIDADSSNQPNNHVVDAMIQMAK